MKKLISLFLAIMMVFSLATVASAAEELGSITINGIGADTEYAIYKILDLESYSVSSDAYSYKANADWAAFVAANSEYLATDATSGYVTWVGSEDAGRVAEFAQLALAYAEENDISPVKTSHDDKGDPTGEFVISGEEGKFSDLELGWYLVDSSAGALCGLTTTNPDASIQAKNASPNVEKYVKEDLTDTFGPSNTADIGQIVEFLSIIHVTDGAEDYVLHDKMSDGLTFVHNTETGRGVTKVEVVKVAGEAPVPLTEGTDYKVVVGNSEDCDYGCTFEVVFTKAGMEQMDSNNRVMVYYNAMLNREAIIAGEGNSNKTELEYGEDHFTTEDETKTYTFSIDIVKTDSANKLIDGAEFRIYSAENGGNEIGVVVLMEADDVTPVKDENGNPVYRRARDDEMAANKNVPIVVKKGKVTVIGFDNGTYWLEETVAPDGYNKLTARQKFIISDSNLDSVFNGDIYSTGSGVHVVNKTGNMLPETGAMGTTLFITFGMFTVLAAGVLLVTKKRMSMIED